MFAHHKTPNMISRANPHPDPERQRFQSYQHELQAKIDRQQLAAFKAGRLVIQDPETHQLVRPDRVFLPSLSRLVEVVDINTGVKASEIRGGWIEVDETSHQYAKGIPAERNITLVV